VSKKQKVPASVQRIVDELRGGAKLCRQRTPESGEIFYFFEPGGKKLRSKDRREGHQHGPREAVGRCPVLRSRFPDMGGCMSSPVHMQTDGLRVLSRQLNARLMVKLGVVIRESEATHLLNMLKDSVDTLERMERGEFSE
jgi:hypothetical protein